MTRGNLSFPFKSPMHGAVMYLSKKGDKNHPFKIYIFPKMVYTSSTFIIVLFYNKERIRKRSKTTNAWILHYK